MSALERKQDKRRATGALALSEYTSGCVIDGKYRLIRGLGEGGMGSVWAAHSSPLDVSVALKLLRVDTANEDSAERLLREARVMARLADPGIVRVFDVGQSERGEPYIVMELLAGATLRQVLDSSRLEPVRAVRLLLPIVRALECAHRAGVVHRDVKPDNIVLAQGARGDLQPKLLDFGAAKLAQSVDNLTRVGLVVGSPLYMSPEQARGEAVDHRTDLWSACVVLYEAVTGKPPFWGDNTHALLHAINTHEVRSLPDAYEFDAALWDIVRRGLTKNRDDRWQNARDLMLELAAWLRAQGTTEDITGTALQGRGLGRFSSTPSFGAVHGESGTKSKGRATAMLEANIAGDCQRLADAMVHSGSARPIWRRLLVTRSPLFWGTVAAVFFLSLLFGFWVQRTSGPSPAPTQPSPPRHLPAAETAPLAAPQHPASEATSVTSPAARASNDAAASSGPAPTAERSTAPRPKARPPRGPSAQKEKSESPPSRALAPTRATKPAFKNPFD